MSKVIKSALKKHNLQLYAFLHIATYAGAAYLNDIFTAQPYI